MCTSSTALVIPCRPEEVVNDLCRPKPLPPKPDRAGHAPVLDVGVQRAQADTQKMGDIGRSKVDRMLGCLGNTVFEHFFLLGVAIADGMPAIGLGRNV